MRLAATLLGGLLAGLCFLPSAFGWYFWLALVPLYWVIEDRTPGRAFLLGWLFGSVAWGAGMFWLFQTIRLFTPFPLPVAAALFSVLCAGHGAMAGCWAGTTRSLAPRLSKRMGERPCAALALASVPGLVWAQSYFPSLFPVPFAFTQHSHLPALQSMELFGPAGLAWLLVGFNCAAYIALRFRRSAFLAAMAFLAIVNEGYGLRRLATLKIPAPSFSAALVQSSVPVDAEGDRKAMKLSALNRLTREALAKGPLDLAVWPETSYEGAVGARLMRDIPHPVPLLFGTVVMDAWSKPPHLYNAALLTGPAREPRGAAFKRHLMPFGEHIPFGDLLPRLYGLSPHTSRMTPAPTQNVLDAGKGARLGVLICYEDILGEYVRDYIRLGATVLVTLANDGWIVPPGPETHLRLSALQAIAARRFLLRSVNTGASAVIDPAGRILSRVEAGQEGFIRASVSPLESRTLYSSIGDLLYHLAALLWLGLAAWAWRIC